MFMTRVTYTARGRGYEVRLTTEGTRELVVTSSGVVDPSPVASGSDELTANVALVTRLAAYASNELAYRRLRSPEKRASHRLAADRDERDAIAIAEMVIRMGSSTVSGWCSGCFEQATHGRVKGDERPKRRFLCL